MAKKKRKEKVKKERGRKKELKKIPHRLDRGWQVGCQGGALTVR